MLVKTVKNDTKRVFLKKGACSHTFFYILDREFGHLKEHEECASDPLAGGIFQQGYQCGMLWGCALAVGAESFRRHDDRGEAIAHAITATQHVMESFIHRAKSADCADITNCDFTGKFGLVKYLITGKPITCFHLADKWAPEAIQSAHEGLSRELTDVSKTPTSCASEVAKRMGASDEEMVMVAGFAGGLGLSGNACGALSAAIWMNTLARVRKQNYKYTLSDPDTEKIIEAFYEETGYEMECCKITGQRFKTIAEHAEFIRHGGCEKLMNVLADTNSHFSRSGFVQ
jgi:hypothetical protein